MKYAATDGRVLSAKAKGARAKGSCGTDEQLLKGDLRQRKARDCSVGIEFRSFIAGVQPVKR
jgi:hypothetical protein